MKAIVFDAFGGAGNLRLAEVQERSRAGQLRGKIVLNIR